jgi:hypothetical protein
MINQEITTMRSLLALAIFLVVGVTCTPVMAQTVCSNTGSTNTLYCVPILAVQNLTVIGPPATPVPGVPPAFLSLTASLGAQVSQIPTPSPASGFTFVFGPNGLTRERDLGSIYSELPSTVGKHKLYLAFTYQYFQFDQIDSVPFKQIPVQISGCDPSQPGCGNFIETNNRLSLTVNQFAGYATFGVTSRIDVSAVIPVLDVRMNMLSTCRICFQQLPSTSGVLSFTPNSTTSSASGIGDVILRMKGTVYKGEKLGLAIGLDVRIPSGDAQNFLGSGAVGARPFAAFGYRAKVSPHANIGYQMNANSILASTNGVNPLHLPNSLNYAAGVGFSLLKSLNLIGDFLGQTYFNANRVYLGVRGGQGLGNPDTACSPNGTLPCQLSNFNTSTLSLGGKWNPFRNVLITGNVLIKLDHNGLHYKPSPMIGISYTF